MGKVINRHKITAFGIGCSKILAEGGGFMGRGWGRGNLIGIVFIAAGSLIILGMILPKVFWWFLLGLVLIAIGVWFLRC